VISINKKLILSLFLLFFLLTPSISAVNLYLVTPESEPASFRTVKICDYNEFGSNGQCITYTSDADGNIPNDLPEGRYFVETRFARDNDGTHPWWSINKSLYFEEGKLNIIQLESEFDTVPGFSIGSLFLGVLVLSGIIIYKKRRNVNE